MTAYLLSESSFFVDRNRYIIPLLRKLQQLLQGDAQDLWHHLTLGLLAKAARASQRDMQSHRSPGGQTSDI